jgi:hypothetical protein
MFSVLLSVSFLLSNGPAKALLMPKSEALTETSFSGKRQQQLLIVEAVDQFDMSEQSRTEEPDADPDEDGLCTLSLFILQPSSVELAASKADKSVVQFGLKIPLYVFQHSWKSFLIN